MTRFSFALFLVASAFLMSSCGDDDVTRTDTGRPNPLVDGGFVCFHPDDEACLGDIHFSCESDGEFLRRVDEDCAAIGQVCLPDTWCSLCRPGQLQCDEEGNVIRCKEDASGFDLVEECDIEGGEVCRDGACRDLCSLAVEERSYVGCEFYAADLDNAAIARGRDASSQQYAVVVSNPSRFPTEVIVEANDGEVGGEVQVREVESTILLPGDLEVFRLPRREVDGSSSNAQCFPDTRECPRSEVCVCSMGDTVSPCVCRNTPTSSGLNDGTHTHVSSQAYRVRSQFPIIAYQFNPLDNVGVFSNDASLLIPTSAISSAYTVVGWPQTIADADCDPSDPACLAIDFDPSRDDEDLRASLTIVGTLPETRVTMVMGERVGTVLPYEPAGIPLMGRNTEIELEIGEFDVINLETDGLNGDFTGTRIVATQPVSVFVGSEASDAPRFDDYARRLCCADHLEEQLFGDETLGSTFMIARMPARTVALNQAFLDPLRDSVAEVNEREWVRVVAVSAGETTITTTLPAPDDRVTLSRGESAILRATQDFLMFTTDGKPIAVLQVLPSQQAIGIPNYYPGGDPAIVAVPPIEQYRKDYVFLTPNAYAFDFVVITADADANILLDDAPLDPLACTTSPADGIERLPGDPPPDQVVHRCQLSFPDVNLSCDPSNPDCVAGTLEGDQNDGVHNIIADKPVGIVVYGFDSFVSYAYAAGLNLKSIPR